MTQTLSFQHKFVPGEADKPVVLALHGTGGTEEDLIPIVNGLFPGSAILAPRGRVSEHGAARFFRRIAEGVFDLEDLKLQTEALADFVADAATEYGFDAKNVWAIGFSNGANIAASLLLSRPETLSGAVLLRSMVPFEPEQRPNLAGKPIFLAAGTHDPLVPVENVSHLAEMYQQSGADVKLNVVPSGHNLTTADIGAIHQWLGEKL